MGCAVTWSEIVMFAVVLFGVGSWGVRNTLEVVNEWRYLWESDAEPVGAYELRSSPPPYCPRCSSLGFIDVSSVDGYRWKCKDCGYQTPDAVFPS